MSKEFKLVPASMLLDKATIGAILFHCGDGSAVDLEDCSEGLLWVGSVTDDDGKEVHGLHIATAEYPEEGSTTLIEFGAPLPPALGGEPEVIAYVDRDGDFYADQSRCPVEAVILQSEHRAHLAPLLAEIERLTAGNAELEAMIALKDEGIDFRDALIDQAKRIAMFTLPDSWHRDADKRMGTRSLNKPAGVQS